jgi:hypothetical protein
VFALEDPALVARFARLAPDTSESAAEAVPVFVNCFNRVSMLRLLVEWLLDMGQRRVILLDNASTYPPLLAYYHDLATEARVIVVQLGSNLGHTALWTSGLLDRLGWTAGSFVYTDPDVLPDPDCPRDFLQHFAAILEQHPAAKKAGFGLRIDDLPLCYRFRAEVQDWEAQFWEVPLAEGQYLAPIDTTFALYRGGTAWTAQTISAAKIHAIRTGFPYIARHLDWYMDTEHPTDEQLYYRAHAIPGITSWSGAQLPPNVQQDVALARQGMRMIRR